MNCCSDDEGSVLYFVLETDSDMLWEVNDGEREMNSSSRKGNNSDVKEEVTETSVTGVLSPTTCLHLGDVILFTVDTHHYPLYDL